MNDRQTAEHTARFRSVTAVVVSLLMYLAFLAWPGLDWLFMGVGVAALVYAFSGLWARHRYERSQWK